MLASDWVGAPSFTSSEEQTAPGCRQTPSEANLFFSRRRWSLSGLSFMRLRPNLFVLVCFGDHRQYNGLKALDDSSRTRCH